MIAIKQYGEKWRIELEGEVWEFKDRKDMEAGLKQLLDLKIKQGQIKEKK